VTRPPAPQLDLFPDAAPVVDAHQVLPAAPDPHLIDLAARLPRGIQLGTSSWHFPGWARLVYDRPADKRILGHEGLAAYAQHPLLRCVGLDRTFYAPMPAADFRRYADQVPDGFGFVVKAPMACTARTFRDHFGHPQPNPRFLDAVFVASAFVQPCLEGLGARAAALVFQFPPLGAPYAHQPGAFARLLRAFLEGLPRGPLYAVELRDHAIIGPDYLEALRAAGAHHCLGLHPRMPVASEQARETGLDRAGPLVVRWNLHAGYAYEEAKARYAPFTRLVDEDLPNRIALARLCVQAVARGEPAFVVANNKAEGSAPLTLFKLAEQIVATAAHARPPDA
jgi:uncharacterized protein YecE (DUF72 family)